MADLQISKATQITKLGTPLTVYNKIVGVCLNQLDESTFMVSMSNAGVSWKAEVHIDDISVGAEIKEARRTNEYIEKEDEACSGGGCKI